MGSIKDSSKSTSIVHVRLSSAAKRGEARICSVWRHPNPRKARNAITDFYRTHKYMPDLPDMAYVPEYPFDDVVSDLLPYVKKLVDDLPYDYRQALLLTEYEGLTQRELAERFGKFVSAFIRAQKPI